MKRSAGKTHTLYPATHLHKDTVVDCYRCGIREKVYRMRWLKHQSKEGYAALCADCHTGHGHEFSAPTWAAADGAGADKAVENHVDKAG